jgi:biopolymer transport protein ExbB/TolQ
MGVTTFYIIILKGLSSNSHSDRLELFQQRGWNVISFNDCVETDAPLKNDKIHLLIRFSTHAFNEIMSSVNLPLQSWGFSSQEVEKRLTEK